MPTRARSCTDVHVLDRRCPRRRAGCCRSTRQLVDGVVHPVEAAQEGRLAAAGRADQRRDLVLADVEADVLQRLLVAVEDADLARSRILARRARPGHACAIVPPGSFLMHRSSSTLPERLRIGRSPVLPLALEALAQHDRHQVHQHQEPQQDDDRRRGSFDEGPLRRVRPQVDLHRQHRRRIERPAAECRR